MTWARHTYLLHFCNMFFTKLWDKQKSTKNLLSSIRHKICRFPLFLSSLFPLILGIWLSGEHCDFQAVGGAGSLQKLDRQMDASCSPACQILHLPLLLGGSPPPQEVDPNPASLVSGFCFGLTKGQESRLPGEISITSDMQMTPPLWQKVKRNSKASWWKWKRRVKDLT